MWYRLALLLTIYWLFTNVSTLGQEVEELSTKVTLLADKTKPQAKIFVAPFSRTTLTELVTTTRDILTTCYSTTMGAGPCNGRKRRSYNLNLESEPLRDEDMELDASLESDGMEDDPARRVAKNIRFFESVRSTHTVTTNSFIMGTSVTVTAQCTIPGVFTAPSCGLLEFN